MEGSCHRQKARLNSLFHPPMLPRDIGAARRLRGVDDQSERAWAHRETRLLAERTGHDPSLDGICPDYIPVPPPANGNHVFFGPRRYRGTGSVKVPPTARQSCRRRIQDRGCKGKDTHTPVALEKRTSDEPRRGHNAASAVIKCTLRRGQPA